LEQVQPASADDGQRKVSSFGFDSLTDRHEHLFIAGSLARSSEVRTTLRRAFVQESSCRRIYALRRERVSVWQLTLVADAVISC
jgi:hypothetical protein